MSKSLSKTVRRELEDNLEDAIKALRRAAEDLSEDAEKAVAQAARALREASESLAEKAGPQARAVAAKAVQEVKEHPVASTVAALTAAAALIQILGNNR